MLRRLYRALGPLRIAMAVLSLITVVLMPSPDTPPAYEGWAILSTAVAPAVVPILVAVYLLDILMAALFAREPRADRARERHFGFIVLTDVLFIAMLLAVWLPIILALAR